MHPWDDVLEGKCQTHTLQLLKSVPFRSSKSPSRIENILCFQITLLLLGSQHNSFVFYPKSMGIRGPAEMLALPCSEHARQQYVGDYSELPSTPGHGETLRMLPTSLGSEWVPPCQGCRGVRDSPSSLAGPGQGGWLDHGQGPQWQSAHSIAEPELGARSRPGERRRGACTPWEREAEQM